MQAHSLRSHISLFCTHNSNVYVYTGMYSIVFHLDGAHKLIVTIFMFHAVYLVGKKEEKDTSAHRHRHKFKSQSTPKTILDVCAWNFYCVRRCALAHFMVESIFYSLILRSEGSRDGPLAMMAAIEKSVPPFEAANALALQ